MPNTRRKLAGLLAAAALLVTLAGCNDDKPDPIPTEPTATTATPTKPAWEAKYTADEIAAYEAALATWNRYEKEAEPIWAAGKVTPDAEKLFERYFAAEVTQLSRLDFYEKQDLKFEGLGKVLSSEPTRVKLAADGGSVTIRQCIDPKGTTGTQKGKAIDTTRFGPQYRTFEMSKVEGQWLVFQLTESEGKSPCAA